MPVIRVQELGEGQHPSEVFVGVTTAHGEKESLIVDRRSIDNGTLDIGFPVGGEGKLLLVELPRETMSGKWRVWVNRTDVLDRVPA
ncbi:hypothetical protein [Lichenibacterium ramalinae]|uniref:hypothetical protein n=1 Tax=Lichenibacterium ramalinae TaxID=2316527 RepID=UPI00100E40F6|nr:hypothetical protein [Lichenibacterium ramalinae]